MQILALERELKRIDSRRHAAVLRDEAASVWALKKRSVIRDIWFTRDRHAVLMLECSSEEEARQHLATLPLVRAGLISFEVLALQGYDGFDRLIAAPAKTPHQ